METILIELTPIEKEIDALLGKSGFYLQTYRAIDAQKVLIVALDMIENNEVKWQVKAAVYRNMGQALYQQGSFDEAMKFFNQSYDVLEDGNDKACCSRADCRVLLASGKQGCGY